MATMNEFDGEFTTTTEKLYECPKCSNLSLSKRIWESSCGGYEDVKYECSSCGYYYWIDGIDS